ncbi:LuxR C-terminal-related transcriptional regulator [Streptomyces sp. NBC_00696]|nr:LuxR C-terminal-related transcriptional regulator [Streptomyces sp. NBC_00696]
MLYARARPAEIAAQLHPSTGTVKPHISSILTRTDPTNQVQAAVLLD